MTSEDKYWRTQLLSATPKGAFLITLLDAGLINDIFDERAENAWSVYKSLMKKRKCFNDDSEFMKKLP